MSKVKIVRIWGGLGNQLFQYSFGKYLEESFNLNIIYNIYWFKNSKKRKFVLQDILELTNPLIDEKENLIDLLLNYRSEKLYKFLLKKNINFLPKKIIGYWQDIRFAKYLNKNCFKENFFKKDIKLNEEYYVLHFRGDDFYLSKDHLVLDIDYYQKSIKFFEDKKIYCISDDNKKLDVLMKKLRLNNIEKLELNELDSFRLICNSKGGIASNSTFCWWAAYLSSSKNWIFPKQWLKKKTLLKQNLYIDDTLIL